MFGITGGGGKVKHQIAKDEANGGEIGPKGVTKRGFCGTQLENLHKGELGLRPNFSGRDEERNPNFL